MYSFCCFSLHVAPESHLSHHAASMHGIAPPRRARPWIPYWTSEQSRRAPQLGQRSWQACMSIIMCPHMGHSFFLLAGIHHTPGSASYYLFWQARCPRQRPSGPCAHVAARVLRYMLLTRQKRHLSALTGQSRWILTMHMHTAARAVCCTTPNRRHRMPAPRHLPRHV